MKTHEFSRKQRPVSDLEETYFAFVSGGESSHGTGGYIKTKKG